MKLFKCIKSSNEFFVDVTEGKVYECENIYEDLVTILDDFYVNIGMDMKKFKETGSHCKIPKYHFEKIFVEVE